MSINVYWACFDNEWLRAEKPESVYKNFMKNPRMQDSGIQLCPGTKNFLKNYYGIKSIYSYEFSVNENGVFSEDYDQNFFENHVLIRSIENKLFSFRSKYIFFTDEDSLQISVGIQPFLENNYIAKNCTVVPGKADIGKWFRAIDFAFYLNDGVDKFSVNENDIFQYIAFDTDEKINFKQFIYTDKIKFYADSVITAKHNRKIKKMTELEEYYSMMRFKKQILNEIKANLL